MSAKEKTQGSHAVPAIITSIEAKTLSGRISSQSRPARITAASEDLSVALQHDVEDPISRASDETVRNATERLLQKRMGLMMALADR